MQYQFKLPSGKKIKLRELTAEQSITVMDRWGDKYGRIADELAKAALIEVDGVTVTGQNRDEVWAEMGAKDRVLILEAYNRIHNPNDQEREDFFASMTMETE